MSGRLNDIWSGYSSLDKVANRFDNYTPDFEYGDMSGVLGKLFNSQSNLLTKKAGDTIQRGQRDTASRMASQGITGGSVYNNAINKTSDTVGDSFASALEELGIGRMEKETELMNTANQNKFQATQAAQNVDLQNFMNMLNKWNAMNGMETTRRDQDMKEEQMPGVLEDIFSGIQTVGSIAAIPMTGGTSGMTLLGKILGGGKK
jgi:hypothetical protein